MKSDMEKDGEREAAVARMAARALRLPDGYRFDREEANARQGASCRATVRPVDR